MRVNFVSHNPNISVTRLLDNSGQIDDLGVVSGEEMILFGFWIIGVVGVLAHIAMVFGIDTF